MALKSLLLFLLGAAIAFGQYAEIQKSAPYGIGIMASNGCLSAPAMAPLICRFMQHNMELPYKPQLITPSTYIPPIVVEKCETPQLQMDIGIPPLAEEKLLVNPQRPVLPPITFPKFPVPVKIEQPNPRPIFMEPREPVIIPERPVVSIPAAPELPPRPLPALPQIMEQPEPCFTEVVEPVLNYKPPPQFQSFVMPNLPVQLVEGPMIVPSFPAEDQQVPVAPTPEYIQPLVPVPAAPELPPARLPEIPVRIEIPPQPVMPPMNILPPPIIFERPVEEPCITGEFIAPQPPKLSEFIMPEPVKEAIKEPVPMPIFPIYPDPAYIADPCEPIVKTDEIPPYFVTNARPHSAYKLVNDYVMPNTYGHRSTGYLGLSALPNAF